MAARAGRRLSVFMWGFEDDTVFPLRRSFEGQYSPLRSSYCVYSLLRGPVFSSLVRWSGLRGVYWPSNEHEDGRSVALKTTCWTITEDASHLTNKRTQAVRTIHLPPALPPARHQPRQPKSTTALTITDDNLTLKATAIGS